MADDAPKSSGDGSAGTRPSDPLHELKKLRTLIVGPEQSRIDDLDNRLKDSDRLARQVSGILPEAILIRSSKDKKIARVLQPTIEASIRSSVQKNPKVLADAIFPLMGPGIRKAIASTIMGMIQSFNQILNHSFSIQGLKWRLEALRTRRPYGEVVLIHTLLYQVEQVFLIHRETGVVLQHVVAGSVEIQDPDLVSGMLTAIQDFMQDSFGVTQDQTLDTLRIGNDRTVWIEQGPHAIVAAVIRGTPPLKLRPRISEALADIHMAYSTYFDAFDGDTAVFEITRPRLESCLVGQVKTEKKKLSPLLVAISAAALVMLIWWGYAAIKEKRQWAGYLEAVRSRPGVMLTQWEKKAGSYHLAGLKDPLAQDPVKTIEDGVFDTKRVSADWQPFYSLQPQFVLKRAMISLQPPETVTLDLKNGVLTASGNAGHMWIHKFRTIGHGIPGIREINGARLVNNDIMALYAIEAGLEERKVYFPPRSYAVATGQEAKMGHMAKDALDLEQKARLTGKTIRILLVGHADTSGSEGKNKTLSLARAGTIKSFFMKNGVAGHLIGVKGVGYEQPVSSGGTEADKALNRRVSIEIEIE